VAINHHPNYVSRMKYWRSKITNKPMLLYGNLKVILEQSVTERICTKVCYCTIEKMKQYRNKIAVLRDL